MRHPGLPLLLGAVLTVGCATSTPPRVSSTPTPAPAPTPAPTPAPAAPQGDVPRGLAHEQLQGVLWVQTSAEFEALTTATYAAATAALSPALADTGWTAALEQQGDVAGLPPAVIVDVDETVLDNSPFQAQSILEGTAYCDKSWPAWTAQARARALPGALAFARAVADRGVTMFYVTNRDKDEEAATVANLKCAEHDPAGQCLAFPSRPGARAGAGRGLRRRGRRPGPRTRPRAARTWPAATASSGGWATTCATSSRRRRGLPPSSAMQLARRHAANWGGAGSCC